MWIRAVAYLLLAFLLAQVSWLEARHFSAVERFSEHGYVERTQVLLLAFMVVVLAGAAWRRAAPRQFTLLLALFFAILLVRENDQWLEQWLPHGFWKWPALALLAWGVVVFIRHRREVLDALWSLTAQPAFGVLLAGFTTLVFSRFFGRGAFWEAVMEERYWRPVKNAAEEGTELFALGLLAAGVVEWLLACRRRHG